MKQIALLFVLFLLGSMSLYAQDSGQETIGEDAFLFGDALPDAPELAARGDYAVGVRRLTLIDAGRVDVLSATRDDPTPLYDRPLPVYVWYPATLSDGQAERNTYEDVLGRADDPARPLIPFQFDGRAALDAEPNAVDGPYPLLIVSHGYPGSSLMLTGLTENLASKGYVVVAIDHTDSTFADVADFGSTLLNRSQDQLFVVSAIADLNAQDGFLMGMVDAENTALIGYSMGGYGTLNAIGAGYNGFARPFGPGPAYDNLVAGSEAYAEMLDDRVKAAVLFAPWGGDLSSVGLRGARLWDEEALAGITIPTFWAVGSHDDSAMFAGVESLFNWSINSDRYLLVYENALHNVAPNPPPPEAVAFSEYERYSEPVWDRRRMNNINQHFLTAFLGYYLKGMDDYAPYLDLIESSNDGVYDVADSGEPTDAHTYWHGFANRTALGMRFIHLGG